MSSKEQVKHQLHERGLRCTEPRRCVVEALYRGPKSHAQLLSETGLDRVTLYRNLQSLQRAGLVYRVPAEGSEVLYALCQAKHTAHVHFFCDNCNQAYCLEPEVVRVSGPWTQKLTRILLMGVCPKCL